jgi:hypothetical protein
VNRSLQIAHKSNSGAGAIGHEGAQAPTFGSCWARGYNLSDQDDENLGKNDLIHVSLTALPANGKGARTKMRSTQKCFLAARFRAHHSQFASSAIEDTKMEYNCQNCQGTRNCASINDTHVR